MIVMTRQYEDFARRYLDVRSTTEAEALALCPFHTDSNPSFQFNMDSGLYVCFSCAAGGNIRSLERRFGVSHRAMGVGIDLLYQKLKELERPEAPTAHMREDELSQFSLSTTLWDERGLNEQTVKQFELGYDIIKDAMTVPVRNINGELLGVVRRYMDPDMKNRYRYPKGFHKREHLFGSWLVAEDDDIHTVALTEGAIDAMSVWQAGHPAMAIYGSSMSMLQVQQLRLLGINNVTLFFDNDKVGQEIVKRCLGWRKDDKGKWHKTDTDLRRWFDVRAVDWRTTPAGIKDANDLTEARIKRMLADARRIA